MFYSPMTAWDGREPKNCTQVRVAPLQHIFAQVKVKNSHIRNDSSKRKKAFGKKKKKKVVAVLRNWSKPCYVEMLVL